MQACVDWVLIILGTQVIKKKRLVRPVFPDYLSVSYDYGFTELVFIFVSISKQKNKLLIVTSGTQKYLILSNHHETLKFPKFEHD